VVDIELPHGEVWLTNPVDVEMYQKLIQRLWDSAATEDEARSILTQLAHQQRASASDGP
jgi:hypothetical protein